MENKEEHYEAMMQSVERYCPSADMAEIQKAYEYAEKKHAGQLRKSGEPYIIHPLAVAEIVAEIGLDTDAIVASLLHDCLEDTDASYEEISRLFGQTVAELVEGVTKLTRVQYSTMCAGSCSRAIIWRRCRCCPPRRPGARSRACGRASSRPSASPPAGAGGTPTGS